MSGNEEELLEEELNEREDILRQYGDGPCRREVLADDDG